VPTDVSMSTKRAISRAVQASCPATSAYPSAGETFTVRISIWFDANQHIVVRAWEEIESDDR
jgi:hypothetical protein